MSQTEDVGWHAACLRGMSSREERVARDESCCMILHMVGPPSIYFAILPSPSHTQQVPVPLGTSTVRHITKVSRDISKVNRRSVLFA